MSKKTNSKNEAGSISQLRQSITREKKITKSLLLYCINRLINISICYLKHLNLTELILLIIVSSTQLQFLLQLNLSFPLPYLPIYITLNTLNLLQHSKFQILQYSKLLYSKPHNSKPYTSKKDINLHDRGSLCPFFYHFVLKV
jgi:hypothetical protein